MWVRVIYSCEFEVIERKFWVGGNFEGGGGVMVIKK